MDLTNYLKAGDPRCNSGTLDMMSILLRADLWRICFT